MAESSVELYVSYADPKTDNQSIWTIIVSQKVEYMGLLMIFDDIFAKTIQCTV